MGAVFSGVISTVKLVIMLLVAVFLCLIIVDKMGNSHNDAKTNINNDLSNSEDESESKIFFSESNNQTNKARTRFYGAYYESTNITLPKTLNRFDKIHYGESEQIDNPDKINIRNIGITNIQNNCYINAFIQSFISLPEFTYYFLSERFTEKQKLCRAFQKLLVEYKESKNDEISIKNFIDDLRGTKAFDSLSLKEGKQEDMFTLITIFIDTLDMEISGDNQILIGDELDECFKNRLIYKWFYHINETITTFSSECSPQVQIKAN